MYCRYRFYCHNITNFFDCYFGVTDISVNGQLLDENADFNQLTENERVNRIIEISKEYGCHDDSIRGLVFCSRKEEANTSGAEETPDTNGEFNFYQHPTA